MAVREPLRREGSMSDQSTDRKRLILDYTLALNAFNLHPADSALKRIAKEIYRLSFKRFSSPFPEGRKILTLRTLRK